jgi:hypothetical protein
MAPNADVDIPTDAGSGIAVQSESGPGTLEIPAEGDGVVADDGTVVFEGLGSDSAIAVQTTASGVRAVIDIQSETSPESYEFNLGGNVADLVLEADGSVTTVDSAGSPSGQIAPLGRRFRGNSRTHVLPR